jgi:endonuclease/exonuclease/phosphatase family metal-dependent hydrolase
MSMEEVETGTFANGRVVSKAPDVIRVVSWNIARGCQLDGVTEFLLNNHADLIILQETDRNSRRTLYRNVAQEISQKLRMNYVFGIEFQELSQGSYHSPAFHGQATLSPWPISDPHILRFQRQSKFWHPYWWAPKLPFMQRRLGGRMALRTVVSIGNRTLVVYNLHLESRSDDSLRRSQLIQSLEDANRYSSNVPVIAAGDFNFDIAQRSPSSVIANACFYNPFAGIGIKTTRPPRFGQGKAVDWILIRGSLRAASPQVHSSVTASDHYPISVHLHLPQLAQPSEEVANSPDNLGCPDLVDCPH